MYFHVVPSVHVLNSMLYMEHDKYGDDFLKSIRSLLGFKVLSIIIFKIMPTIAVAGRLPIN